ncbi:MAG: hypothetical protein M1833_006438 [Piccolia ochrophora]|nr:MAG: hypothetical protein M1833_006438 [Piccolia ochrophora]
MVFPIDYFQHRRDCRRKKEERVARIAGLPEPYRSPVNVRDRDILNKPLEETVQDVHKGLLEPIDILRSYGKAAFRAHDKTNCLTEVLLPEAEEWAKTRIHRTGPLAGIPVSLKDSVVVGGFDATVGYSSKTGKPYTEDGAIVRLLKDAGMLPYKVWGRTLNPYNPNFSPGGSTGGEAALLALGGSRIGIGSDVAGSVRVPAHFSGIYALRCSTGRWPKSGSSTSMPGQEGVQSVFSPMARTMNDLTYFSKSILSMKPWTYDHSVHPLPWRDDLYNSSKASSHLRIGVMESDGKPSLPFLYPPNLSDPSRPLASSKTHTITPVHPPSPFRALRLASLLLNSDGCTTFRGPLRTLESSDPGAAQLSFYASLPRPLRYLYYLFVKHVRRDPVWADLLRDFGPKTSAQLWRLVAEREAYRAEWHRWWDDVAIDVLLTVPNATPATRHGGMRQAVSSCGYTFLFNLLDYTAGVLPVTHVDRAFDALPPSFDTSSLNGVARGAYALYDADEMHGLPVGVQVVGRRLEEEKVLGVMEMVRDALEASGEGWKGLDIEG